MHDDAQAEAGRWQQLAEVLVCPRCGAHLVDRNSAAHAPFVCPGCTAAYPVVDGMPIFLLPNEGDGASALAFEQQWKMQAEGLYEKDTLYGETAEQELQSFLERFGIGSPSELAGKRILDVGCGSGRLTRNLAGWAPHAVVVGGDRSGSAHLAHARCRDAANAFVIQMDLHHPPFAPASFDLVYADGVLPHVPDAEAGLACLDRLTRPGGQLFLWIYPRRFSPYRAMRDLLLRSHRLPRAVQRTLEWGLAVPLWATFKLWEPLRGPRRRSLREVVFQLHDNLTPPYQHRRSVEEVMSSFARLGYENVHALGPLVGVAGVKAMTRGAPGASASPSSEALHDKQRRAQDLLL